MGRVDGGPYIKSPSNGKFIEVDAERGDYVLTTDVMGYVANTYDMYIGANIEETDITTEKRTLLPSRIRCFRQSRVSISTP